MVVRMSPICPAPWQFTTWHDLFDHWQTLIAGVFALVAGLGTIWVTRSTAKRQIAAAHKEAKEQIAAAREQTKVTADQTATTVQLERERHASEDRAFYAMLEAAMERVLAEATWLRDTYANLLAQTAGASSEALVARNSITKGAFAELRAACVRLGSPLTSEFLDLERKVDSFGTQWEDRLTNASVIVRMGKHAGLGDQLAEIEAKAKTLRDKAAERIA
jgi:hypothetical protein